LRGKVDIIVGGFPCQSFSIAGKRGGFEDTRGTLFFDVARATNAIKPKYVFMENVKGLLNHDKGNTISVIVNTFKELGYRIETRVFNSKYFGVPQNRERIFILGIREDLPTKDFLIDVPIQRKEITGIENILEDKPTESLYLTNPGRLSRLGKVVCERGELGKINAVGNVSATGYRSHDVLSSHGICTTVMARDYKDPKLIIEPTTNRVRRLSTKEYWRLQGFPDWAFEAAEKVNSNSQLYKQAGNSVTVNVIAAIAERFE